MVVICWAPACSPSLEKVGHEKEFCTKVKERKSFFFIENHIFYLNILASAFFFFNMFLHVSTQRDTFYRNAFFTCGISFVFLSYTSRVCFEVHFILSLMTSNVIKPFSSPYTACCFQACGHWPIVDLSSHKIPLIILLPSWLSPCALFSLRAHQCCFFLF